MSIENKTLPVTSLPPHLGGHALETHIDAGALRFLTEKYKLKSFLDVGCGPGGMVDLAAEHGLWAFGIDGDFTLRWDFPGRFLTHDFTTGPAKIEGIWDLGWSCEFLEHVEEKFMNNYMESFSRCKRIVVTYAPPGQGGHHHVNERDSSYWITHFAAKGFLFDANATKDLRNCSTMIQNYIRSTGLVFHNSNLDWTLRDSGDEFEAYLFCLRTELKYLSSKT
jgi:hypothetical protein